MTNKDKGRLIASIVSHLKYTAREQGKNFCEGDTFFSLAFKSDNELITIANLTIH